MLKKQTVTVFLIALIPLVFYYYIVLAFSFNGPVSDDYDAILSFLIRFLDSKSLTQKLGLVFSQHGEHRIALDRVITLAIYYLSGHIDFRALVFIGNLALMVLALILLSAFQLKEHKNRILYFIPALFFLFQPQYYENIFIAMAALSNFYVLVFAFLSLYILTRHYDRFFLAVFFAVLATFTQGSGLFVFIEGVALLIFQKRYRELIIWSAVMAVSTGLYFYGYVKPAGHPSITKAVFEAPLSLVQYFFTFIGSSVWSILHIGVLTRPLLVLLVIFGLLPLLFFIWPLKHQTPVW